MKLYHLYQNVNNNYDTYDSAIVAANSEEEARNMPVGDPRYSWCEPKDVQVEYIGEAKEGTEKEIILSSYNAG